MEKAIVNMTNWELYVYDGEYNLSGIADNHPMLGKDTRVCYTSKLVRSELTDDVLTYETQNTVYVCPLKFMTRHPYCNVVPDYKEELIRRGENSDNELDQIIAASAYIALDRVEQNALAKYIVELRMLGDEELRKMEEVEAHRMYSVLANYEDSIYLEVSNVEAGNKLAYHLGDYFGIVWPRLHVGMFQDSVLYMLCATEKSKGCSLDFRYFPKGVGDVLETYSWSDNIKLAVIKNDCSYTIVFNHEEIEPGETKVFTPKTHTQGLFSPDCHNGKTLFGTGEETEE